MFLLRLAILGYGEIEDARDHSHFKYDLNIMFTAADEIWASQFLVREFKVQCPEYQRIVFGDNDLPFGEFYLNAILYVIEHSYKTILLLSKVAIHDEEFMMKLRIALNHMYDTKMQSTILVFIVNIPEEEMPYLLKVLLCEQVARVDWEESEEGQMQFWKQLVKN